MPNVSKGEAIRKLRSYWSRLGFGPLGNSGIYLLSLSQISEDRVWSAEHKPDSLWHLNVAEHQPFAGVIKGGVKFKGEKLDGVMVLWSPDSDEQSDFAASSINLLERFSNEFDFLHSKHDKGTTPTTGR
ncbi:MAG: hypothetical protein DMG78_19480 [Acidobacteria bacterium]|nr:MAG: hypothetical protein DMG78_19480 [Acidobacteriota bacterium]